MKHVSRQSRWLALTAALALAPILTGCGGGNAGGAANTAKSPTAATRAAVRKVQTKSLRAFANGAPTGSTFSANTLASTSSAANSASAGTATTNGGLTLFGGYLNSLHPSGNASGNSVHKSVKRRGRDASTGSGATDGSGSVSGSTFYYDEWLALWVETTTDTGTVLSQKFYEDQAKTKPAGSLDATTSDPAVYPVVSAYHYAYTAGSLKGTSGDSTYTLNADYSGKSSYSSVTSDGWKYKGESAQNADGSSAWTNRTDSPDGSYSADTGTFRSDGSSVTKTTGSDGYTVEYVNNADGSATGKITGNFAGLPAAIVRDTSGKTTITYADGTVDTIPGWDALYNDSNGGVTSDGGATSGTVSGSTDSGSTSGSAGPPTAPTG